MIFILCPVWPWNLTTMILKNNRAPLLSNIKLCVSFHFLWPRPFTSDLDLFHGHHFFYCNNSWKFHSMIPWWEHSEKGVTDRQEDRRTDWTIHRAAWSQLKTIMVLLLCYFKLCASSVNSNWSYSPETPKLGQNLFCPLSPWPLTLTFCMDITSVNDNNSWKFHDATMRETWKRCDRRTKECTHRQDHW